MELIPEIPWSLLGASHVEVKFTVTRKIINMSGLVRPFFFAWKIVRVLIVALSVSIILRRRKGMCSHVRLVLVPVNIERWIYNTVQTQAEKGQSVHGSSLWQRWVHLPRVLKYLRTHLVISKKTILELLGDVHNPRRLSRDLDRLCKRLSNAQKNEELDRNLKCNDIL